MWKPAWACHLLVETCFGACHLGLITFREPLVSSALPAHCHRAACLSAFARRTPRSHTTTLHHRALVAPEPSPAHVAVLAASNADEHATALTPAAPLAWGGPHIRALRTVLSRPRARPSPALHCPPLHRPPLPPLPPLPSFLSSSHHATHTLLARVRQ